MSPLSDEEALIGFEKLYRAHYSKIVAYARRRCYSVGDVDDVVSATFLVAWRRLEELVQADQPLAWLYAVAYRTVLSQRREVEKAARLAEKATIQFPNRTDTIEDAVEAKDRLLAVAAAARDLSETDQEILRLVGWEQYTHVEIASVLGISRVLVRTRLLRARRRLQAAYERRLGRRSSGGG
jgi:RNA polymerase sigma factor (sigma-70 family)